MSEKDGPSPRSMHRLDPDYYLVNKDRWREVKLWVIEHGLNPMSIPRDALVEFLDEDHLEIESYDMSTGLPAWDEDKKEVKRIWLNVQIKRPFPMDCIK